jgi:hypothetical protein
MTALSPLPCRLIAAVIAVLSSMPNNPRVCGCAARHRARAAVVGNSLALRHLHTSYSADDMSSGAGPRALSVYRRTPRERLRAVPRPRASPNRP